MRRRFAYAFRSAQELSGLSAQEIAEAVGVDRSSVTRWSAGDALPQLSVLKSLAETLGVRPELLYDPPAVPDYPLSEYLTRMATAEGLEAGLRKPRGSPPRRGASSR